MSEQKIVLINESRRAWSFPAFATPSVELTKRGKIPPKIVGEGMAGGALFSTTELEAVERFKAPILHAPALKNGEIDDAVAAPRIEVPRWYFEKLLKIKSLKSVFGRKRDGIAVGRTRAEANAAAASERDNDQRQELADAQAEIARLARELDATKSARTMKPSKELADAQAEISRLTKELDAATPPKK